MQNPQHITIKEFLVNSPRKDPKGLFLLAHGAGKGMATPFMETFAQGMIKANVRIVRFHFPYMEEMLRAGSRRPPNGGKILRQCFSELIEHCVDKEHVARKKIIIGGKSMGARVASMIADEHKIAGVICLGYPFHPPKKPQSLRIEALEMIRTPTLICQGERDPQGHRAELEKLPLSKAIRMHWLTSGDANFKPGRDSNRTLKENMDDAINKSTMFIDELIG
jgi:uncharacterized protein